MPDTYRAGIDSITAILTGPPRFDVASEREVAEAILEAATHDGDVLRFVVGVDAQQAAHMRRETSEAEYLRWASERFGG